MPPLRNRFKVYFYFMKNSEKFAFHFPRRFSILCRSHKEFKHQTIAVWLFCSNVTRIFMFHITSRQRNLVLRSYRYLPVRSPHNQMWHKVSLKRVYRYYRGNPPRYFPFLRRLRYWAIKSAQFRGRGKAWGLGLILENEEIQSMKIFC